MSAVTTKKIW